MYFHRFLNYMKIKLYTENVLYPKAGISQLPHDNRRSKLSLATCQLNNLWYLLYSNTQLRYRVMLCHRLLST